MIKFYLIKRSFLFLLLLCSLQSWAQVKVAGKVTSGDDGTGLPGVSILEKGTSNGTVTDADGNYSISANESAVLVFSFVGFESQEVPVAGKTAVDITMQSDITALSEIVILGYGEQERKDVTGSVVAITSKDFNKGVMTSPQDLLVGKLAGVQVTSNSGAPGSGATIRIRGGSSMSASNDPLVVIDGFPVDNAGIAGMSNAMASINPSDIESVTVLKDASATAIYGSRASNGVIIITTKKGKEGKPQLGYNAQVSVSTPIDYIEVLDGDEFRTMANDLNEQGAVGLSAAALTRLGDENTDWQKEIYRNAVSHDHNLSIAGSTGIIPYRASYGFTDQQGILKTTSMQRHSLNLNLSPSFLDDHLKVTASVKASFSKSNFGNTGAIGSAIAFDPTQPIMNGNTKYGGYFTWINLADVLPDGSMNPDGAANTFSINNPVALLNLTDNQSNVNRTIGTITFDYRLPFFEDLRVNLNAGMDRANGEGHNNAAPEAPWTYRNYSTGNGELIDYSGDNSSELLDLYFNYVKELGQSKFDVTAGYSWQHFEREGWTFQRNGDASVVRLSKDESQYINENFLVSFFGRVHYSLKEKYLLTATLRNDGSSRFAEENRWGLFPAVALAWNVMEESFLDGVGGLSNLKFRLGYGVTGQQDIGNNYPALAIYRQSIGGASYQFGNEFVPTLRPDPYDANIKWEETTTYNVGLDLGLFGDKLSATVDLYQRETEDLINFIPIAAGSNFSNFLTTNVGTLENKGIEVTLRATPVASATTTWNVGFNFTRNMNEITRLTKTDDPSYPGVDVGGISGGVGNFIQNHRVGHPANSFYVFEQVYNSEGMPIEGLYVDRTGNGGVVSSSNLNKYHYNSPAPNVLMGVNSMLTYKKIDLSFSGRFSLGNYVYNNGNSGTTYSSVYVQSGFFGNVRSSINDTKFFNPQYWSDHFVEDASFFKMDNINVGYNFSQLLTEKLKARVSFTVQNAFMVTNYSGIDPELGNGIDNNLYPRPRVFLMGVNLTF